jgi:hypothetical protein
MFTGNGLGGHMSRAHPGQSVTFNKKQEIMLKRRHQLKLLRDAQDLYRIRFNQPNLKLSKMSRSVLERLKNELRSEAAFIELKNNPMH